ncbi:MAG: hypothetical protein M3275_12030 [Thermoproteota archaeon]|nr:hypothetical protein [Thermoproteota archaeon]
MGKEIRIIKKASHQKFEDYTFMGNSIELKKIGYENDSNPSSSSSNDKKYKEYDVSKLRNNPKKDRKSRDKSRLAGGHGTQSHSPIYE